MDSIRILVAEDDFLVGKEITYALEKLNYQVVGMAADGEKALEMTLRLKPDVVMLDIRMPKLSGLEAARQIQDICPTPIVILTAYESRELLEKASTVGVAAYLTKPPHGADIMRAVTIAIARHQDILELRELYQKLKLQKDGLENALLEIKTLQGIIPICANCKKIRDDQGFWEQVEVYLANRANVQFSHGICPECVKKLYPEIADKLLNEHEDNKY